MEGKAPPPHFGSPTDSHLPPWAVLSCSVLLVPEEAPVASDPPAPHPALWLLHPFSLLFSELSLLFLLDYKTPQW